MTLNHRHRVLLILASALLLRLVNLGSKSLWLDEAFAVWQAELPPADIWQATYDNHPPLYYLILHLWMALGRSEAVVRLPSVLVSMLSLSLTYLLGLRLGGKRLALLALALLAVAPLDVWYAQEARMVSFVIPPALLIALGILESRWRAAIWIAAGLGSGLYLDYTIIPLWAVLSGHGLARWWRREAHRIWLVAWFAGSMVGWLIFSPLWAHLALVFGRMSNIFVINNARDRLGLPVATGGAFVVMLLSIGLGTAVVAIAAHRIWRQPAWRTRVAVAAVAVFAVLTLLMPVPRLFSVKRLLVTGWPFVILAVSWLLLQIGPRRKPVTAGLLATSLIAALVTLFAVPKDDWRGAVAYLERHADLGDVVWLEPVYHRLPYNYYQPGLPPQLSQDLLPEPPEAVIWHIAERLPGRPVPSSEAEAWLDANRSLVESEPLYRLEVRRYASP